MAMATTAALIETTAPEPVLLELATSGGVVADQYDLPTEPGLASLTIDLGGDGLDLLDHAQELPGGVAAIVAPHSGSKVNKLLSAKADTLAEHLKNSTETVLADCGRISTDSPVIPILTRSSLVPIVIRPSRQDFHLAALTMAEINDGLETPLPAGWIIVGPCPWSPDEIIAQYGLPIFTNIAEDRVGAEAVAGFRRFRRRSPLARSARAFAEDLAKHLRVSDADDPLSYLSHDDDDDHGRAENGRSSHEPAGARRPDGRVERPDRPERSTPAEPLTEADRRTGPGSEDGMAIVDSELGASAR